MNRASARNLSMSVVAYLVFMLIVLVVLGFQAGPIELVVWLVLLLAGIALIVRRFRRARLSA